MVMISAGSGFLSGKRLVAVGSPIHLRRRKPAFLTRGELLQQLGIGFGQDTGLHLDLLPNLRAGLRLTRRRIGTKGRKKEKSGEE